ncbi:SpaA isopeptide-forming pilin-related protein [Leuconostoc pseudomesenteroides]|uniref:SpaA isopeptide-forming pilin-related protein n=1 Tax=Leuconostoc pseudomesenteroides TaxID=33968 RepID=UPI0039EB6200
MKNYIQKILTIIATIVIVLPCVMGLAPLWPLQLTNPIKQQMVSAAETLSKQLNPAIGDGYTKYETDGDGEVANSEFPTNHYSLLGEAMAQNGRHTNAVPAIDNNTAAATNRNYVGNTTGNWYGDTNWLDWSHLGTEYNGFRAKKMASPAKDSNGNVIQGAYDISIKMTGATKAEYEKKKAEIVFVFDRSYSMISNGAGTNGSDVNRLQQAKDAFNTFSAEVSPYVASDQLRVGLVTYSDGIKSVRNLNNNIDTINQDIQNISINIQNDAGTYTDGALERAQGLLNASSFSETKIIVLISDGAASQHNGQNGSAATNAPWTSAGGTYVRTTDEPLLGHADDGGELEDGLTANDASMNYPAASWMGGNTTADKANPFNGNYQWANDNLGSSVNDNRYRVQSSIGSGDFISIQSAIDTAATIKQANTKIYVLGTMAPISGNTETQRSTRLAEASLKRLATSDEKGTRYYYDASATDLLVEHLESVTADLFDFVKDATLTDALAPEMLLDGNIPSDNFITGNNAVKGTRWAFADNVSDYTPRPVIETNAFNSSGSVQRAITGKYDKGTKTIKLENIDIPAGQMIEIYYRVRINTEQDTFQADRWYPTGTLTTFQAEPTTPIVEIGEPSVKAPGVVLSLNKSWVGDLADDVLTRPDHLTFAVSRTDVIDTANSWTEGKLVLDKPYSDSDSPDNPTLAANWQDTYQTISNQDDTKTYSLAKFNNRGVDFKYSIQEENIPGYESTISASGTTFDVTNTLSDFKYTMRKINQAGDSLAGAKFLFEYYNQSSSEWQPYPYIGDETDDEVGIVTIGSSGEFNLPPFTHDEQYGNRFRVSEIEAPTGFALREGYTYGIVTDGNWQGNDNPGFTVPAGSDDNGGWVEGDLDHFDQREVADWNTRRKILLFTDSSYTTLIDPTGGPIEGVDFAIQGDLTYINYENRLKPFEMTITKTDSGSTVLAGAKFELYQKVGDDWQLVQNDQTDQSIWTTSSDGKVIVDATIAIPGQYRLTEVFAPDGYLREKHDLVFDIHATGNITTDNDTSVTWTINHNLLENSDNNRIDITLKDYNQFKIPATGSRGHYLTIVATLIILVTGICMVVYMTKGDREHA